MSALEERARSRGFAFAFAAAIGALALLAPARAEAQGPVGPIVRFDPGNGIASFDNTIPQRHPNSAYPELAYVEIPDSGLEGLGFGERLNLILPEQPWWGFLNPPGFINPPPRSFAICPGLPQLRGYKLTLGLPHRNWATVTPSVPKLPGPNTIKGGNQRDVIKGGQSDEKVDTGKGKDNVNPGKGRDDVNLGAGNDKANTRDGEVDKLNGGKGKDAATVDKKDKVKNVEKVRRK